MRLFLNPALLRRVYFLLSTERLGRPSCWIKKRKEWATRRPKWVHDDVGDAFGKFVEQKWTDALNLAAAEPGGWEAGTRRSKQEDNSREGHRPCAEGSSNFRVSECCCCGWSGQKSQMSIHPHCRMYRRSCSSFMQGLMQPWLVGQKDSSGGQSVL
jgi:hypothetical protein